MIEKRPIANLIGHLVLIVGIIVVAFPIYYTFIASTMTSEAIIRPPMSLLPGGHLVENYSDAMAGGVERVVGVSLERLLFNSFVVARRHRGRQDRHLVPVGLSPSSSSAFGCGWCSSG
jgi:sn-glycerol 3-phosphate transport system permease protein